MTTTIKPLAFSLFDIERAIAQKDYKTFELNIIALLDFMDQRKDLESQYLADETGSITCTHQGLYPLNNQMHFSEKLDFYSRLAATITSYLSDLSYTPDNTVFVHFIIFKTYISNIFYLSCYENMDHILFNRSLMNDDFSLNLQNELDIKYLYTCTSLNSEINFNVEQLADAVPNFGTYWYFGMLYARHHPYNTRIEKNLNKIIDAHTVIQSMTLDATTVELAAGPWMLCSYLDRSDRHEIKKSINIAMQKWLTNNQISPGTAKKITRYVDKTTSIKKIVILSEQYISKHAMYRCFHPEFKRLKEHFHVTLVTDPEKIDQLAKHDFHDVIEIKDTAQKISDIINKIAKLEPDLILFPSLGMAKWTIPLANIRLAKHQMMCYGHPASAFSPFIDYSYCSEPKPDWNFQQFCMEKIVPIYQGKDFIWEPHPDHKEITKQKTNDDVVRIAINSSLPKITPRFIQLCRLILEHSSVPVEFNFFLIDHDISFEKSLISRLGNASKVHPPTDYITYMNKLSVCDLAIGTFPFGGSNTNTDVALLGIPKIFYSEDCGLASYSDQTALEKLDLPSILTPDSESELLANLIYLIHDAGLREEISTNIKASEPYKLFYNQKTDLSTESNCKLVEAIRWIEAVIPEEKISIEPSVSSTSKNSGTSTKIIELSFTK